MSVPPDSDSATDSPSSVVPDDRLGRRGAAGPRRRARRRWSPAPGRASARSSSRPAPRSCSALRISAWLRSRPATSTASSRTATVSATTSGRHRATSQRREQRQHAVDEDRDGDGTRARAGGRRPGRRRAPPAASRAGATATAAASTASAPVTTTCAVVGGVSARPKQPQEASTPPRQRARSTKAVKRGVRRGDERGGHAAAHAARRPGRGRPRRRRRSRTPRRRGGQPRRAQRAHERQRVADLGRAGDDEQEGRREVRPGQGVHGRSVGQRPDTGRTYGTDSGGSALVAGRLVGRAAGAGARAGRVGVEPGEQLVADLAEPVDLLGRQPVEDRRPHGLDVGRRPPPRGQRGPRSVSTTKAPRRSVPQSSPRDQPAALHAA